jgi:hypothetical protein
VTGGPSLPGEPPPGGVESANEVTVPPPAVSPEASTSGSSAKSTPKRRNRQKRVGQRPAPLLGFSPEADETFLLFFNRYIADLERFSRFKEGYSWRGRIG